MIRLSKSITISSYNPQKIMKIILHNNIKIIHSIIYLQKKNNDINHYNLKRLKKQQNLHIS